MLIYIKKKESIITEIADAQSSHRVGHRESGHYRVTGQGRFFAKRHKDGTVLEKAAKPETQTGQAQAQAQAQKPQRRTDGAPQ